MKSRKYESYEAAIAELKKIGDLKHGGKEKNFAIYKLTLPTRKEHIMFIHDDGLVTLHEPGNPFVVGEQKKEEPKVVIPNIYNDGICDCKAAGKFRWQWVGGKHIYMCVKCNRPVYFKM